MKEGTIVLIACSIIGIGLIASSVVLAIKGADGWGWFLFAAPLVLGGLSHSDKKKKKKSPPDIDED